MYHRILTRALDTPLFISEHKLNVISERVLLPLMLGTMVPKALSESDRPARQMASVQKQKLAIIPVMDTLFSKNGAGLSGATTYESISAQIEEAASFGATDIGFYIDSPGGEGFGLFSLMHQIRNLPERGIRTFSFTDGMMTSAAYGIGSATQRIYATESSVLGSIAAVLTHIDRTEADNKAGLSYTILRSKEEKALGSSHEPLTAEIRSRLETYLAKMDAMFNNEILKGRAELTLDGILQMKGSEFLATEALQLGLVDEIVPTMYFALSSFTSTNRQSGKVKMNDEELLTQLTAAKTEVASLQASLSQAVQTAVVDERTRVLAIIGQGQKLNLSNELIQRHIEKGYSTEASLDIMTEIREARETETAIDSSTGLTGSVQDDASFVDAKTGEKVDIASAYKKAVGKK